MIILDTELKQKRLRTTSYVSGVWPCEENHSEGKTSLFNFRHPELWSSVTLHNKMTRILQTKSLYLPWKLLITPEMAIFHPIPSNWNSEYVDMTQVRDIRELRRLKPRTHWSLSSSKIFFLVLSQISLETANFNFIFLCFSTKWGTWSHCHPRLATPQSTNTIFATRKI